MSTRNSRSKKSSSKKKPQKRFQVHISSELALDLTGYALLVLAAFTLLALLSLQRGLILGFWINLLTTLFGWGVYAWPVYVGVGGFYLGFRRYKDSLPWPQPEQVAGAIMIFFTFLITAYLPAELIPVAEGQAAIAHGGGLLGAWLGGMLVTGLGKAGTLLTLAVLWILSIFFTFGISPADMARGIARLFGRLRPTVTPGVPVALPPAAARPGTAAATRAPAAPPAEARRSTRDTARSAKPAREIIDDYVHPQTIGGGPWQLPAVDAILEPGSEQDINQEILREQARIIEDTLESLGAPVAVKEINTGPVVTQFGVEPLLTDSNRGQQLRVKVSKISSLADDLALALSAKTLRIQAPIPKKGLVGIEVPNQQISLVALRDVVESEAWESVRSTLRLGLGHTVDGQPFVADLRDMPHMLIAGTTGSGKSVCINAFLAALLLQNTPDELRLLLVDPKRVELTQYNDIPHLLSPVVVDMERVGGALKWMLREMDGRYRKFAAAGATEIRDYNQRIAAQDPAAKPLPYIVVVIDELADLMMLSPQETERAICRLAQMARATGIHVIIATQRPSVDVVTGLIKANFPARIAFAVASAVDSRVILDSPGADRLLGRGDMLFLAPDAAEPTRMQGAFVSNDELRRLVMYWKGGRDFDAPIRSSLATPLPSADKGLPLPLKDAMPALNFEDDLLPDAIGILLDENRASISLLQRRLRIGYTRSARIVDLLDEKGVIGPPQPGGQTREVNRAAAEALLRQAGLEME
ncbi:MAG: DNA translocase FtsK 4TM domain-containing protein [Anaerolineae bacterium]|nr:DNA translocase FtsK 4TM domain-containing protein [Anaerolineae bacterium]